MDFNSYVKRGLLKKQPINFRQIARAEKDVTTISKVIGIDPEWATTIAYHAMLRAARGLIFAHGFLPSDGQQHKTVVEIVGKLLGEEFSVTAFQFEKMRKNRNVFFYDSVDSANRGEAAKSAEVARRLIGAVKSSLALLDPQMKFDVGGGRRDV